MNDPIPLSRLAGTIPLRKQLLSEKIAHELLKLFRLSVLFTVLLTAALAAVDYYFIAHKWMMPADRLVTEHVLMAIIGATIIQLGAVVAAIVYAVFKIPPAEREIDATDSE